ncbi:hypothetical protein [Streptomyces naphthomycinicus]|uniref:hypothetical protein n=1 Tax=Streptomyces naphthomycinicus TaxID=2872625 RepID=UPI001CED1118|nr:hypothetical protein [Streptomyces sp. TML10]
MSEIVVVYEPDPRAAADGEPHPRRVHAAPAAPGRPGAAGPRTLCGKDTFAMETAPAPPSGAPRTPWYPAEHASRVCQDCDAVMAI